MKKTTLLFADVGIFHARASTMADQLKAKTKKIKKALGDELGGVSLACVCLLCLIRSETQLIVKKAKKEKKLAGDGARHTLCSSIALTQHPLEHKPKKMKREPVIEEHEEEVEAQITAVHDDDDDDDDDDGKHAVFQPQSDDDIDAVDGWMVVLMYVAS